MRLRHSPGGVATLDLHQVYDGLYDIYECPVGGKFLPGGGGFSEEGLTSSQYLIPVQSFQQGSGMGLACQCDQGRQRRPRNAHCAHRLRLTPERLGNQGLRPSKPLGLDGVALWTRSGYPLCMESSAGGASAGGWRRR